MRGILCSCSSPLYMPYPLLDWVLLCNINVFYPFSSRDSTIAKAPFNLIVWNSLTNGNVFHSCSPIKSYPLQWNKMANQCYLLTYKRGNFKKGQVIEQQYLHNDIIAKERKYILIQNDLWQTIFNKLSELWILQIFSAFSYLLWIFHSCKSVIWIFIHYSILIGKHHKYKNIWV